MENIVLLLFSLIFGFGSIFYAHELYKEFEDGYSSPGEYEYSNVPFNKGIVMIMALLWGFMFLWIAYNIILG